MPCLAQALQKLFSKLLVRVKGARKRNKDLTFFVTKNHKTPNLS
jgi:hypothetical protein